MKRIMMTIVAAWMMITSMNAQRLTNIQAEARFITDKMVVELGLSKAQRNNLLNINFTYLNGIRLRTIHQLFSSNYPGEDSA